MLGTMLIDSNIAFSLLLEQNDYEETNRLFDVIEHFSLKVTILDFALYSMTINFLKRGHCKEIKQFLETLNSSKNISIYRPKPSEISEALSLNINLDFDDKLHYYLAKKKNLSFISYDQDFDKTDLKRLTPTQVLKTLRI
jgi:predicted nucleic acid-binding protein